MSVVVTITELLLQNNGNCRFLFEFRQYDCCTCVAGKLYKVACGEVVQASHTMVHVEIMGAI
jgi:hypothetical protein